MLPIYKAFVQIVSVCVCASHIQGLSFRLCVCVENIIVGRFKNIAVGNLKNIAVGNE